MKKLVLLSGVLLGITLNTVQAAPDVLVSVCKSPNPPKFCQKVVAYKNAIHHQANINVPTINRVNLQIPNINRQQINSRIQQQIKLMPLPSPQTNSINKSSHTIKINSWSRSVNTTHR